MENQLMKSHSILAGAAIAAALIVASVAPGRAAVVGVTVGTTAVQVLPAPTVKPWFFIRIANEATGSTVVACTFGSGTPALNSGGSYTIAAGGSMTWQAPGFSEMDPINCIAGAANTPVTIETH